MSGKKVEFVIPDIGITEDKETFLKRMMKDEETILKENDRTALIKAYVAQYCR